MHHRFPIRDLHTPGKPKLSGGAAAVMVPMPEADQAIDRRLEELRELALQTKPLRRFLETGPPQEWCCPAA